MSLFNASEPLLRSKQEELDIQDLQGLLRVHWKIGNTQLFSAFYTRIDQVFLLWGLISAAIFATAQFMPLSWSLQAILWSVLTIVGSLGMVVLAWFWVKVERLCWVIYAWVVLMLFGLLLTDLGIFFSWGFVLLNLCPLWLGLSAIGYFCTGWGLRSCTFLLAGMLHLAGIWILSHSGGWQFVTTGAIMAGTLFFLAEVQWDMRPPLETALLTVEQKQFNQEQYRRRQSTATRQSDARGYLF
ncbi:MAG: hypothetical protein WCA35_19045 [Kovacikia sp.]